MLKDVRRGVFGLGFALGVLSTVAVFASISGPAPQREAVAATGFDRAAFQRALDVVLDRYVEPVEGTRLFTRGLKHMLAGLDPYSHYLTAEERRALRSGAGDGQAGLAVAMKVGERPHDRWLEVVAVEPASSAAAAGLRPGDHVLRIGDRDVAFLLSQAEAEALLRGPAGDSISVLVQRRADPSPSSIELQLRDSTVETVRGRLVERRDRAIAHVTVRAFGAGAGVRVKRTLAELRRAAGSRGLAGIVLDVRGNPGGSVDEALVVADLFVDEGVLTRTRGRGGRILREERAHTTGTDTTTPIVVLQDRHTASAAELLAAALQEHGRAKLVGERSYGKGTVQEVVGMEDGSVLTLTIARYFSPKDNVIDGVGIAPDLQIKMGDEEAILESALSSLTGL